MTALLPSIQRFFHPEARGLKRPYSAMQGDDDGHDREEFEAGTDRDPQAWIPPYEYEESSIGDLHAGPRPVALMGRIVNIYDQTTPSKQPDTAKGFLKLLVRDVTGVMIVSGPDFPLRLAEYAQVKLWYADVDWQLRLGCLVSIWTVHVSKVDSVPNTRSISQHSSLMTSIFPERDNSSYFMTHTNSDNGTLCKNPLGYKDGKQLNGLMTLKTLVGGGHEVPDRKVLVCIKSIGPRKRCEDENASYIV